MRESWAAVVLLMLGAAVGGFGCKKKRRGDCPRYEQVRAVPRAASDVVVAEVNGRPILASEVRKRAADKGMTVREAVQELIDEELMVQEAERRGLHRDPVVVEAGKQAAIYRLLAETFEKDYSPKSVPDAELRRIYKRERPRWFNRPELRRFAHAYYTRPWFKRNKRWYIDIEKDRVLRRVMENFQRLVAKRQPRTVEAFRALAEGFDQGEQTLEIGIALQAHRDLRKPFADALFKLAKAGDTSGVIETRPWYHVAFLIKVLPKKDISFAKARTEIRDKMYPHFRSRAFSAWVKKLKKQCPVRVKPENLPVGNPGARGEFTAGR